MKIQKNQMDRVKDQTVATLIKRDSEMRIGHESNINSLVKTRRGIKKPSPVTTQKQTEYTYYEYRDVNVNINRIEPRCLPNSGARGVVLLGTSIIPTSIYSFRY